MSQMLQASRCAVKMFQSTSRYDIGIDAQNVRLGWTITSSERGKYQTAYHIVIADEKGTLAWDSGWIASHIQVGIVAQNLMPETLYRAKVQIKDECGNESSFSDDLVFETSPAFLEGQWLSSKRLLRNTFTLSQPLGNVRKARCYMTSAGLIELRLNGNKIGNLVWNPTRTVHTEMTYYNTFDVTDLLRDGKNAVGAYTSETDGYYKNYKIDHNLRGMLRIYYQDGSVQTVATGNGWTTCANSEIARSNPQSGEDIDARFVTNWDTADFDEDTSWEKALSPKEQDIKSYPAVTGSVVISEHKPISAKEIMNDDKISYILDFGQNMQGAVRLETKGDRGVEYLIEYAELLNDVGDIWANTTFHFPKSTYVLSGRNDCFFPRFFYTGFRYVRVTTSDGSSICPNDFTACFLSEDLDQTGFFETSNDRLNKIFRLYLMSQLSNILGTYTDCPQREKAAWTGDASVTKEAALLTLNDYASSEAFMELMVRNIQSTGAPCNQLDFTKRISDDWNMAWTSSYFVFPYEVYMATGDTYYIEKYHKRLQELFDFFVSVRSTEKENIKSGWNTYDWVGYDNHENKINRDYLETAYFYYDGKLLSEMLKVIGVDTCKLDESLQAINDAIQENYSERGYYSNPTQTENSMALDLGLVPDANKGDVLQTLVSACNDAKQTLRTGVLGTKAVYDVLSNANQHRLLMEMTLNQEKCSFGYYLDHGATTLWEFWDVAGETFHSNISPVTGVWDSQNHVMFGGGLAAWMFEGLGGIRKCAAGYARTTFRPGIESGLDHARVSINALVGTLSSDWKIEDDDLIWNIEVPANTTATVIIPMPAAQRITESSKDIFMRSVDGITYVGQGTQGEYIYAVGSGRYSFMVSKRIFV